MAVSFSSKKVKDQGHGPTEISNWSCLVIEKCLRGWAALWGRRVSQREGRISWRETPSQILMLIEKNMSDGVWSSVNQLEDLPLFTANHLYSRLEASPTRCGTTCQNEGSVVAEKSRDTSCYLETHKKPSKVGSLLRNKCICCLYDTLYWTFYLFPRHEFE